LTLSYTIDWQLRDDLRTLGASVDIEVDDTLPDVGVHETELLAVTIL
jgi:hypothetical protein